MPRPLNMIRLRLDLQTSRPPGQDALVGGSYIKPASKRWVSSLPDLIRVLARAGLDAEALSLAASARTGQLRLLAEVARGQARRGAYSEAFRTVNSMKSADLSETNEPSRVTIKPDGTVVTFTQTAPIRPVESMERNAVVRGSLDTIRHYAADTGDADTFHLADKLFHQYPDQHAVHGILQSDFLRLDLLVRRGEFDHALASVEVTSPPQTRLFALRHVMDSVVNEAKSTRDDVLTNCYR